MPLPKVYTSEDYWNLPEGERAELIGGCLYKILGIHPMTFRSWDECHFYMTRS